MLCEWVILPKSYASLHTYALHHIIAAIRRAHSMSSLRSNRPCHPLEYVRWIYMRSLYCSSFAHTTHFLAGLRIMHLYPYGVFHLPFGTMCVLVGTRTNASISVHAVVNLLSRHRLPCRRTFKAPSLYHRGSNWNAQCLRHLARRDISSIPIKITHVK